MNKVYKHIWSETWGQTVVVSECAKGAKGKKKNTLASTLIAGTALLCAPAFADSALPSGGEIVSGSGSIDQSGNTMTVTQSSQRMIANWQDFSIGADASATFHQPGADAVALNRVIGSDPSQILGNLNANGQVFLINPNGVVFGQGAQVQTGGFVASTLDMADGDFLAGNYHFSGSGGEILNRGDLSGAVVALIAPAVINEGSITGDTALAAGTDVTLDFGGDGLISVEVKASTLETLVDNRGLIRADGGTAILTAKGASDVLKGMVNNSGTVQARTLENRDGRILLLGDMDNGEAHIAGTLDASAPDGGDGGFIETSAADVKVADDATITSRAADGETGTWLIDPTDFTIAAEGGDISGAALSAQLENNDVQIESYEGAVEGGGDIFVNDTVNWTDTTLTLTADRSIEINAEMNASGTAGLALQYAFNQESTGGSYSINAPVNIASSGSFSTREGSTGNVIDYTIITDLADLQAINGDIEASVTGNYVLGADIDAADTLDWNDGAGFLSLGGEREGFVAVFEGRFDGLGHKISDLWINRPDMAYVGLFGVIGNDGLVQNLGLDGGMVIGGVQTGALAGMVRDSDLRNVWSSATVQGESTVGGLVGVLTDSGSTPATISNASSSGDVTAVSAVGGLVGVNQGGVIEDSRAGGDVTATGEADVYAGGLVGVNLAGDDGQHGWIGYSHASGDVTGDSVMGGLVGYNAGGEIYHSYASGDVTGGDTQGGLGGLVGVNGGDISFTYATGAVTATQSALGGVGGLVGINGDNGEGWIDQSWSSGRVSGFEMFGGLVGINAIESGVTDSYWDMETSGQTEACSALAVACGATGLTTAQAVQSASYTNFDVADAFDENWFMIDGETRPFLLTEYSTTITNAHQLQLMAARLDADYRLANDVDMSELGDASGMWANGGAGFAPVGDFSSGDINSMFQGRLDGLGHTISALTINRPNTDYVGLFGIALNDVVVRNLNLENADILGHDYVGALVGRNWGTLSHITLDGQVAGNEWVGGLLGGNKGELSRSWSRASVSGGDYTGGLVGVNETPGRVEQVYAAGPVDGGRYVGGVAGYNLGDINDSYSTGTVDGRENLGGFVGYNTGSLSRNYSTGVVNGGVWVQGLGIDGFAGSGSTSVDSDTNFSDRETTMFAGAGFTLDTYWLLQKQVYEDFDFDNVWFMVDGETRPILRFEWSTEITNAHQLQLMAMDLSADYTLANDIDLGAALNHRSEIWGHVGRRRLDEGGFSPIGNSSERFLGSFDGQGHVISGLSIDRTNSQRVGLFGVVGETGVVRNVGLEGGSVAGNTLAGSLAGENYGTVENAYARVDVAGQSNIGGLVGQNSSGGVIRNTYAAGAVTSEGTMTGGLVGFDNGDIIASYYDTQASGQSDEGKGLGLSTEAIKNPLNALEDGWDFENIWGAPNDGANDGYLVLRGGGRGVYDYYVRLSADGEMRKVYGEENPSLAGINVTGLGAEYVGFAWDGAIDAGTGAGNYHFADALDLSFARGLAGDYYIDYYADASHVDSLTIDKAQLSVTALDAGHVYNGQGYSGGNGFSVDGFVNGDTEAVIDDTGLAWGGDAQGAVNVGSYALSLSGLGAANYEFNYNPGALLIDPAALTVTANDAGKTYDAVAWNGGNGVNYSGFVNGEDASVLDGSLNYGGSAQGAVNAGEYVLTASGLTSGNYDISYENGTLTIDKAPLTLTANSATVIYNGSEQSVSGFTATGFVGDDDESVLGDVTTNGGTGTNAGSYTHIADGSDENYALTFVAGTLTIDKAPLTVTANSATVTYNGSEQRVGGFTASGFVGGEDESVLDGVTTIGGTGTNAGTYTHTADGSDENYELSFVAGSLTIDKALATVTANSATTTYNGSEQSVGGFSVSGLVGDEDESVLGDVTTNGGAGTNAGAYVHAATGTDENYELIFVDGELTINKALATVTANSDTLTYNGDEQSIGGFTATGLVGEDESVLTGVSTSGGTGTNAGTYIHIASGSDENYQLTFVDGALAIDPAVITAVTGITAQDKVFNARNDVVLDLSTAQFTGMVAGDNLSLAGASGRFADVNAGEDKLVNISSLVLGGNELGNYVLGATTSTTTASISKKPASFIANGVATYTGEIAQPDWFTWVFDPVIGDDNFTLEGELFIGGEAATAIDAGVYEVLPSGLSLQNYELTFLPGELHILPRPISVGSNGITAEGKTYDGTPLANLNLDNLEVIQLPGLGGKDGLIEGDDVSFSGAGHFADANAGTGKNVTVTTDDLVLSGTDAHNYYLHRFVGDEAVSEELVLSADIHKAPLTVTANDIGKTYDGQTFAGGYSVSYSGFVNNESPSVLTGELAFGGEAIGAVDAGIYDLTASGLDAGNYAITYENGTLTIDRALVTLDNIGVYNKTYDGTPAADLDLEQALFDGLFGYDELNLVSANGTFGDKNAGTGKAVTISELTLGGADANNYILANNSVTATADIDRATITAVTGITAADKTYDGTTAAVLDIGGANLAGMIAGDDLGISNTGGAFADKNAGTGKTVTISGLALTGADADNYQLASDTTATTANIHKAALAVTLNDDGKTYDGQAYNGGNGIRYSGFVAGEDENDLSGTLAFGGTSQGAVNAGSYTIAASGLSSGNYDITYTDGTLTVDRAALTVSTADVRKTYDGTTAADGSAVVVAGRLFGSDSLNGGSFAFTDKNAGSGKIVTVSDVAVDDGNNGGNYAVTYVDNTSSAIDRATIAAVTGITALDKLYDRSSTADLATGNATFVGMVAGDELAVATAHGSFDDPAPGLDKNVSITGIALDGADADNYILVDSTAEASASITDSRIAPLLPEQIALYGIAETDRTGVEEFADNRELLTVPAETKDYIAECNRKNWRDCNY